MLATDTRNVYGINIDWWDWDGPDIDSYGFTIGLIDCDMETFRKQLRDWAKETGRIVHCRKVGVYPDYLVKHAH